MNDPITDIVKNAGQSPEASDGDGGAVLAIGGAKQRDLPHNLEAEQNFLGAILIDNELMDRVEFALRPEHFYDPVHQRVFETALRLISRGQLASPVTLKAFFTNDPAFQNEDPAQYLGDLVDGVVSLSAVEDYARAIHDSFVRRELVRIGDQTVRDASHASLDEETGALISKTEQALYNLAENDDSSMGLRSFDTVLEETIQRVEQAQKSDGGLSGLSTGLTDLNNLMGGLHDSDLIILAGRPGMGKTALATNIAFHIATTTRSGEKSAPVAFFSLEMAADQLGTRILSEVAEVDSINIRKGELSTDEFGQLLDARSRITSAPFFIDDTPALSVSQLASRARRLKRTTGLGMIVVDYLQLLQAQQGMRPENRVQEISNISRSLKAIAKELQIPVMALSQLSRAVEQREDKRPQLADLRESGSIEQDADVVLFVYREYYYLNKSEPEQKENETTEKFGERVQLWRDKADHALGKAEVIVAKQRHGPTGAITVSFVDRFTKFQDLAVDDRLPEGF